MPIKTVEEVREYVQKEYWEDGTISGYKNKKIDWNWGNGFIECLEEILPIKNMKALDLGCALGELVACMDKKGIDAYGIDISDYAIEIGHVLYSPLKERTTQGSIHELPYEDNSFDFIHSQQVFEHLPSKYCLSLAREAFRVAKPGTILWAGLVLDTCSDFQPQGFNPEDNDKTHINLRPKKWWDRLFTYIGWETAYDFDEKFRQTKTKSNISYFEEYGWHSICYRRPK